MDQTPESIGMIASRPQPEIHPPQGPVVDPAYIVRFAQAHEQAGFDRVLVAWGSTAPDAIMVATHAAKATSRIGFMVAHRPDFIAPTLANRQFATLDQLSGGRAAIHVISGGSQTEQRKDGDFPVHDERYARTEEYVTLLKRFSLSMRPVLGDTEAAAWARTGRILAQMRALRSEGGGPAQSRPESVGSQRCSKPLLLAGCATSGSGRRSPRRSAPVTTAPRWSARRNRSPMRWQNTGLSG